MHHWDLKDAQLRQLMEDLNQEVAHRELNVPPRGSPMGLWRTLAGDRDSNVDDEEVTFLGGRGGNAEDSHLTPTAPPQSEEDVACLVCTLATGLQLGTPKINTFGGNATSFPTRKDRSILQTVVPQGTMCQGPLPRMCGLGRYCQVIEKGSGGYGLVHGSYC